MSKLDPQFYAKRFAKSIAIKCVEQGLTQRQVAERIGVSKDTFIRRKRDGLWTLPQVRGIFKVLRYTEAEQIKSIGGIT